jgi:hypothetical protein
MNVLLAVIAFLAICSALGLVFAMRVRDEPWDDRRD